uniref:Uncharacterized protein n=1 Tax=Tanacetum cinerariifolium TaxID=118510 RepID=A0A6L2NES1_TANCI|nr:hypothetical protein [Tanacetum cinerariifolium]
MTYLIESLTLDSANPSVLQGASCTQRKVSVVSFGSISSDSFLTSIMMLVVIMVTVFVVVVTVILVIVVIAIIGVVIVVMIIGIVVVGGVSSILKLLFLIIAVTFPSILLGNPPMKTSMSFSKFGTMFEHKTANSWNVLMLGVCIPPRQGIISQGTSSKCHFVFLGIALDDKLGYPLMIISKDEYLTHSVPRELSGGGVIDLTGDEDPTDEDGDTEMDDSTRVLASLSGEISSRGRKS